MNKFIWFIFLSLCLACPCVHAASIKEPNVAGAFYSADPQELSHQIDSFIQQASISPVAARVQAMIVPHAGYIYSGPVAAYGYKAISRNKYTTIVILAPSHYFPFEGISVWPEGGFKTPLGIVNVDEDFAQKLMKADSRFRFLPQVFEQEHSVEVELPFIQKVFGSVKIVPVLMGNPDAKVCQKLAAVLNGLIGSRQDVLVLASSDMSHYFDYETANQMDAATLETINNKDVQSFWNGNVSRKMEMCGFVPVTTVLLYARERGLKVQVLKHANSGDTAGDKSRVVGYSSVIFYKDQTEGMFNARQKKALLALARSSIDNFLKTGKVPEAKTSDPRLLKTQGAFVTLTKHGQLRGCIGNIVGDKPLWQTIRAMSIAAASQDLRFIPVSKDELKDIDIEISVLTVPRRVADASAIMLGRDGVIVSDGTYHQGVFLPQVSGETHWSKEEFLNELCSQKAGLPPDCWKDRKNSLWTFQADVFTQ
ncbi:MAG: AmmeMemoRadiSam system protein B [Candidatus Omnitrophica bacterium]|nr:AmmeMemoRadiSam system protein B [Candidatus Omnitrophota bacterium]